VGQAEIVGGTGDSTTASTANVAVLQEVKETMLNFPEYIASQHAEYQKRNPVDMK
jgi:hypothetical protein